MVLGDIAILILVGRQRQPNAGTQQSVGFSGARFRHDTMHHLAWLKLFEPLGTCEDPAPRRKDAADSDEVELGDAGFAVTKRKGVKPS